MSTFLHQAYDEATSTKQELQSVQFKVQIVSTPSPLVPPSPLVHSVDWKLQFAEWGTDTGVVPPRMCIWKMNFWPFMFVPQLREVHESEMEKAYQLKAKIIEVHVRCIKKTQSMVVWWFDHMRVSWGSCDSHRGQWVRSPCDKSFVRWCAPSLWGKSM
jgi:hypothetical protein